MRSIPWLVGMLLLTHVALAPSARALSASPCTPRWIDRSPTPVLGRSGAGLVFDPHLGHLLLFGGQGGLGFIYRNDTWQLDAQGWLKREPASSPSGRQSHAMAYDPIRRRVVVFGGFGWASTGSVFTQQDLGDTWEWDGLRWTVFRPTSLWPVARSNAALAFDQARGGVVLFGGVNSNGVLPDTWVWNGSTWRALFPTVSPSPRSGHRMVTTSRGEVLLFGGDTTGETWRLGPVNWERLTPPVSPPARSDPGFAFDVRRGRAVLFGGNARPTPALLNDTWEWDGANWTRVDQAALASGVVPPPSAGHAMTFDPARGEVVLLPTREPFSTSHLRVWTWNGVNWTPAPGERSPPNRNFGAMAFDSARGKMVMFGGATVNDTDAPADTWEWDGRTWTRTFPPSGPPAMRTPGLVYDAARARTVLFGRVGTFGNEWGTWEYDGVAWTRRIPAAAPSTSGFGTFGAVFDPVRARTVMLVQRPTAWESWEWDGATWTRTSPSTGITAQLGSGGGVLLAYDTARNRLVAYFTSARETWERDETGWRRVDTPSPTPPGQTTATLWYDPTLERVRLLVAGAGGLELWERVGPAWSVVTTTTPIRAALGLIGGFDSTRNALVTFGGQESPFRLPSRDTWEFRNGQWQSPDLATDFLPSESAATATFDPARSQITAVSTQVLSSSGDAIPKIWEWSGTRWSTQPTPPTFPGNTLGSLAAVYDTLRQRTVFIDTFSLRVWERDSVGWVERPTTTRPSARTNVAFVFDEARGVTLMFGGIGPSGFGLFNELWAWNGTAWTLVPAAVRPPAGGSAVMGFDRSTGKVVLVTGDSAAGTTWEWDGVAWTSGPADPAGPRPLCADTAMVFDSGLGKLLLVAPGPGGSVTRANLHVWVYDNFRWTQIVAANPPVTPPYRRSANLLPDPVPGRLTLVGGFAGHFACDNQTAPISDKWQLLTTTQSLEFSRQPLSRVTTPRGGDALLSVRLVGPGPVSYRWHRNGVPLNDGPAADGGTLYAGATSPDLLVRAVGAAGVGVYTCVVTSCTVTLTSNEATITTCRVDINADGARSPADISAFLTAYFAGRSAADFDADNRLTPADVFEFLTAYFAGC